MKPKEQRLMLIGRRLPFAAIPLLLTILFSSCQRIIEPLSTSHNFSAEVAKEWYYGKFKKTTEWASSSLKGKKLPDWQHGYYRKVGDMEIMEFPLFKETTTISLSYIGSLSIADKKDLLLLH